jgi:hypothetical protein
MPPSIFPALRYRAAHITYYISSSIHHPQRTLAGWLAGWLAARSIDQKPNWWWPDTRVCTSNDCLDLFSLLFLYLDYIVGMISKRYHERESESCCCCCFSPIVEWVISIEMERVGGGMSFQHTDRQTDADYIYSPNRKQSDLFENFMFSLFLYNFVEEDDGFRSYYILNGRNRLGRAAYYARL